MVQRGKCRCGKVLTFRPGPDGLKRRCARCGSVVRLRQETDAPIQDVNATAKSVPVWSYAATEELRPAAEEIELGSSGAGPALAPPLNADGTGDREILDAVADAEWVDLEQTAAPSRRRVSLWILVVAGAVGAAGMGLLVAHLTGS